MLTNHASSLTPSYLCNKIQDLKIFRFHKSNFRKHARLFFTYLFQKFIERKCVSLYSNIVTTNINNFPLYRINSSSSSVDINLLRFLLFILLKRWFTIDIDISNRNGASFSVSTFITKCFLTLLAKIDSRPNFG